MKGLTKLCKDARSQKLTRGEAVLCASAKGTSYDLPCLNKGEVCVATTFYSTGHSNPDIDIDMEKMIDCPYRRL